MNYSVGPIRCIMRKEFRSISVKSNPTVNECLEQFPPNLQKITRELIAVARKNRPNGHEIIYHGAVGCPINDSPFNRICYVARQKTDHVNFVFFFGIGLFDPQKWLMGDGKRLRHVKIWSVDEAKNPAIAKSIAATWRESSKSVAKIHAGIKKSTG